MGKRRLKGKSIYFVGQMVYCGPKINAMLGLIANTGVATLIEKGEVKIHERSIVRNEDDERT